MTLAVLHLSDIHIQKPNDAVLGRSSAIASVLNPYLPECNAVVILVSGDIAQAGLEEEYELAKNFLEQIKRAISAETKVPVYIIVAPGNHDCDFSGDQEARQAIVTAVLKKPPPIAGSYITSGVAVQKEFFNFRDAIETPALVSFTDELWRTHTIQVGDKSLKLEILNASWMSQRYEQQGGLLFPFERYEENDFKDGSLRLITLHHPMNWYNQANYHPFRSFVHRISDFIFTGHEHHTAGSLRDDADYGECIYIEGAALQERASKRSAFNVVLIDEQKNKFKYESYSLVGNHYSQKTVNEEWSDYRAFPKQRAADLAILPEFLKVLNNPGATLKHPSGLPLQLGDFYVYPDLDSRTPKESEDIKAKGPQKLNARALSKPSALTHNILLEGDDNAGKTRLLYRLFKDFHGQGHLPLFVRGSRIKSSGKTETDKYLDVAIKEQYGDSCSEAFRQSSKEKKILLLDDFDLSAMNRSAKSKFLSQVLPHFSRALITVGENYQLSELFDGDSINELAGFSQYKISPLGHVRRAELIRKWNSFGADDTFTPNQLLEVCDKAEKLIETAKLQHLASTVPIFVLSLLQATDNSISKEMHNSSFAHYYYFLVVGALQKGGIKEEEFQHYLAICTHLSWFIKKSGHEQQISVEQFESFVLQYSSKWSDAEAKSLLKVLVESDLLEQDGDCICFSYPYAYFYFLGRYTNIAIADEDVKEYLRYCMKNLYVRECANTLLFLSHHSGNSVVLDHIVAALNEHFPTMTPVSMSKQDVEKVAALISKAPKVKYKAQEPAAYREELARKRDENTAQDGLVERPNSTERPKDSFQEMVSLTKSIEIAGTLLTHQYSNYSREKKNAAVKAIFDGSLRAIREFYQFFEQNTEELVRAITIKVSGDRNGPTAHQAEQVTRLAIGMLLKAIGTMFITKAGVHVTARAIASNVTDVMGTSPSCAYRLIRIAQNLQRPSRLPRLEIKKLVAEEGDNPCVMGVLQLLILNRMYMYETDHDDKDWALSIVDAGGAAKGIELKHGKTKRWESH